jgi:hypothetical protein
MPPDQFVNCTCTQCLQIIPVLGCVLRIQDQTLHMHNDTIRHNLAARLQEITLRILQIEIPALLTFCDHLEFGQDIGPSSFRAFNLGKALRTLPAPTTAESPNLKILEYEDLLIELKKSLEDLPVAFDSNLSATRDQLLHIINDHNKRISQRAFVAWQKWVRDKVEDSYSDLGRNILAIVNQLKSKVERMENTLQYHLETFVKPLQGVSAFHFIENIPSIPILRPPTRDELALDMSHPSNQLASLLFNHNSEAERVIKSILDFLDSIAKVVIGAALDDLLPKLTLKSLSLVERLKYLEIMVHGVLVEDWVRQVKKKNNFDIHIQGSCPGNCRTIC